MSIKIRHGPPGSYKTSGAVQDDLIPMVESGRPIYTNVRGITLQSLKNAGVKVPPDYTEDMFVAAEMESAADAELWRRFFMWARPGAFFLLDEAQIIFPNEGLKPKRIDWDTLPEEVRDKLVHCDKTAQVGDKEKNRPDDLAIAFEMHRHFNWDFTFTTPNIQLINRHVRQTAEGAYLHRNQALVGGKLLKGRYLEIFHEASRSGLSQRDEISRRQLTINKRTFDCYQSTATGEVSDTQAGIGLFSNPKLVFLLSFLALIVVYQGFFGKTTAFLGAFGLVETDETFFSAQALAADANADETPKPHLEISSVPAAQAPGTHSEKTSVVPGGSHDKQLDTPVISHPSILLGGHLKFGQRETYYLYVSTDNKKYVPISIYEFNELGYEIESIGYRQRPRKRLFRLSYKGKELRTLTVTRIPQARDTVASSLGFK